MKYDPAIIEKFAEKLYKKANSTIISYGFFGLVIGGVAGSFLGSSRYIIIISLIFALVGVLLGMEKAFQLKLQAQTALCQLQIEVNSRENKK